MACSSTATPITGPLLTSWSGVPRSTVLSSGTRAVDLHAKRNLYASEGVREYWIVDPGAHTVEILELATEGYRTRTSCRPGGVIESGLVQIELSVEEIFRA
jgi:Uma2 family endonuclease